ncbi:MAG: hypothetical protein R2827_00965 [Bdellovibrionales bacterium]
MIKYLCALLLILSVGCAPSEKSNNSPQDKPKQSTTCGFSNWEEDDFKKALQIYDEAMTFETPTAQGLYFGIQMGKHEKSIPCPIWRSNFLPKPWFWSVKKTVH